MGSVPHLVRIRDLPSAIEDLRAEAAEEGFGFLDRLGADWRRGSNRFAGPGEVLLGACAFQASRLIAVGGLNRDPYVDGAGIGRLRHLYVGRSVRGSGVGSALVRRLLEEAHEVFHTVRLRTATPEAGDFYVGLGFRPVREETATHVRSWRRPRRRSPGVTSSGTPGSWLGS